MRDLALTLRDMPGEVAVLLPGGGLVAQLELHRESPCVPRILANILDVQAVSPYYVNIIVGLLLLAAVLIDRLRGGDAYE